MDSPNERTPAENLRSAETPPAPKKRFRIVKLEEHVSPSKRFGMVKLEDRITPKASGSGHVNSGGMY